MLKTVFRISTLFLLLILTLPSYAFDGEHFYSAQLSKQDRFNQAGKRLTNIRDILKQDRINYHRYQIKQENDEDDSYYDAKKKSNALLFKRFNEAKIRVNKKLTAAILSLADVTICIIILTPDYIAIHENKCPDV